MKNVIIALVVLVALSVVLAGCLQPPAVKEEPTTGLQEGTGTSASDVTTEDLQNLDTDIKETGDLLTTLDETNLEDSGITEGSLK